MSLQAAPTLQVLGLWGGWRRGCLGDRGSNRGDLGFSCPQCPHECRPVPAASLAQQPGRKGQALQPPAQVPGATQEIRHAAALEGAGPARGGRQWQLAGLSTSAHPSGWCLRWLHLFVLLSAGTQGLGTPEPAGRAPQHQGPYMGGTHLKHRCLCAGFPKCTF